jgi:diguanylate cyclase (GGDEF)-like protein/PAS domain S-box-containing protein
MLWEVVYCKLQDSQILTHNTNHQKLFSNRPMMLKYRNLSLQARYGLAVVAIILAILLRLVVLPVNGNYPFLTLYPTTIAILYFLGTGPGLVAIVMSVVSGYYMFITPTFSFALENRSYHMVGVYLIGALLSAVVIYVLQRYAQSLHSTLMQLQDSENRFRSYMDSGNFLSWMKDDKGRYIYINQSYKEHFNVEPDSWLGKSDFELFPQTIAKLFCNNDQKVLQSNKGITVEEVSTANTGESCCWLSTKFPYIDSAGVRYVGGIAIDISERKAAEERIESLAFYDPLTNLPNRRLLLDRLKHILDTSARHRRIGALLFIDLDNFKTLNDTYGHNHGDQLLQQVAQRLQKSVRKGDTLARFGGDEFIILLEDLSINSLEAVTKAKATGEKILLLLGQPYLIDGNTHSSTPSIGITLLGDAQEDIDGALKRADLAMYQAKAAGRNTLRFFDPQVQATMEKRLLLEADLSIAIAEQQFVLHYQPQVLETEQITGAEALIRWQHPERGMVSPLEFISLAEDTGLILKLGRWVLNEACAQLAKWATQSACAQLTIAVNVSSRQFSQLDFVDQVLSALKTTGADPRLLKLELTESLLVSNVEDIIEKMVALKAVGISFSLDDFGTGYSSLAYLKQLPLDQLKIDQSFVKDILTNSNDAVIAKTIIALANSLGLAVIAEGVETEAQRNFLAQHGCPAYQGYLFSRPLPINAFEKLVGINAKPNHVKSGLKLI